MAKSLIDPQGRFADLIIPIVDDAGYSLVRVGMTSNDRDGQIVQIMIEPNRTPILNLDDCAEISRAIAAIFDVKDPISGNYRLEVSSPGIDRPLTRLPDFKRFVGHEAKIELDRPIETGQKRFRGIIKGIEGEHVLLETQIDRETVTVSLEFDAMIKAQLILTDELIKFSRKEREAREQIDAARAQIQDNSITDDTNNNETS